MALETAERRVLRTGIAAPFLNFLTVPSMERSPSGKSTSTLPCARPKALAFMAGTRWESGSTGKRLILRATHAVKGVSKYSTAPTKNVLAKVRYGSTPHTKTGSR